MSRRAIVRLPDPVRDRVSVVQLSMIAIVACSGGLALAGFTGTARPRAAPARVAATTPPKDVTPAPEPPPAAIAPRAVPAPSPAPAPRERTQLVPGQIAYLRCEGLEQSGSRFPCPRDRELESAVLRILGELPRCEHADPRAGAAELRLSFTAPGAPGTFDLRAPRAGAPLDLRAVSKCAGPALARLQTQLRSRELVVSVRFVLR